MEKVKINIYYLKRNFASQDSGISEAVINVKMIFKIP